MPEVLSPKRSGELITKEAKFVTVLENGIKALATEISQELQKGNLTFCKLSQTELHPQTKDEAAVDWIFLADTLNFSFWTEGSDNKWKVTWKGKTYTGYFAFCAALNRAIDEGYCMTNPKYYSQITMKDLKHIFRGDDKNIEVPLLKERQECLHEVGVVLLENYSGSFVNCIKECENSAEKLLKLVVDNFKCFKDETVFNNQAVSIYKRAQILIADVWTAFKGKDLGYFKDIQCLSMFADYRVPQVLIHFKAMKYSDELLSKLKSDTILEYGSQEEVEIRACSIHAVELIQKEIEKMLPDVKVNTSAEDNNDDDIICNAVIIDHFLWDYRRKYADELKVIPFHKTRSIYY